MPPIRGCGIVLEQCLEGKGKVGGFFGFIFVLFCLSRGISTHKSKVGQVCGIRIWRLGEGEGTRVQTSVCFFFF